MGYAITPVCPGRVAHTPLVLEVRTRAPKTTILLPPPQMAAPCPHPRLLRSAGEQRAQNTCAIHLLWWPKVFPSGIAPEGPFKEILRSSFHIFFKANDSFPQIKAYKET